MSHVKQLDFEYMGKLYIISNINRDNINSANIMSTNKEDVFFGKIKSTEKEHQTVRAKAICSAPLIAVPRLMIMIPKK